MVTALQRRSHLTRCAMERGHAWSEARSTLVRALVAQVASTGAEVLDAGCGTGSFAASLADEGYLVTAVDECPPDAASSAIDVSFADLTALPFGDDSFDVVLMLDVLEHVEDEDAALGQVMRVLRPGGVLVATVPALKRLWSRRDELAGHVRRYERDELVAALSRAGFSIERTGFWAAATLPLLRVSRALARRRDTVLAAEEKPPALLAAALRPILRWDVRRALTAGWETGSSLFAVVRRPA